MVMTVTYRGHVFELNAGQCIILPNGVEYVAPNIPSINGYIDLNNLEDNNPYVQFKFNNCTINATDPLYKLDYSTEQKCTCTTLQLMQSGCKCGQIERDRNKS